MMPMMMVVVVMVVVVMVLVMVVVVVGVVVVLVVMVMMVVVPMVVVMVGVALVMHDDDTEDVDDIEDGVGGRRRRCGGNGDGTLVGVIMIAVIFKRVVIRVYLIKSCCDTGIEVILNTGVKEI